jgi:hypothetical protein
MIVFWASEYESPKATVNVFVPLETANDVVLVVKYLSPAAPVLPVGPATP